jgi:hypothetical protein
MLQNEWYAAVDKWLATKSVGCSSYHLLRLKYTAKCMKDGGGTHAATEMYVMPCFDLLFNKGSHEEHYYLLAEMAATSVLFARLRTDWWEETYRKRIQLSRSSYEDNDLELPGDVAQYLIEF